MDFRDSSKSSEFLLLNISTLRALHVTLLTCAQEYRKQVKVKPRSQILNRKEINITNEVGENNKGILIIIVIQ